MKPNYKSNILYENTFFIKLKNGSYVKYKLSDIGGLSYEKEDSKFGCILCHKNNNPNGFNYKQQPSNINLASHLNKHTPVYYRRIVYNRDKSNSFLIIIMPLFNFINSLSLSPRSYC